MLDPMCGAWQRALGMLAAVALVGASMAQVPQVLAQAAETIKARNMSASRDGAAKWPRAEADQVLRDGWPLYRTERGQAAFNEAMAVLKATDGGAPRADVFKACPKLECALTLPAIGRDGWLPQGRLWVSAIEYVLVVHSPRPTRGEQRRAPRSMRVFVLHEFHNSSRNTDVFDTISSHKGRVFVPLYMSKTLTDAAGRRFVMVVQVSPFDVISVHATNHGSAGPGMEVAKNASDALEPLQALTGIVVAQQVTQAAPWLKVVNHHGAEGLAMLEAHNQRLQRVAARGAIAAMTLPFVGASSARVASASAGFETLLARPGQVAQRAVAQRGLAPQGSAQASAAQANFGGLSPLADYLRVNLAAMLRQPHLAALLPASVEAIAQEIDNGDVVHLLDGRNRVLGRIAPYQDDGVAVAGKYVFVTPDAAAEEARPFALDLSKPARPVTVAAAPKFQLLETPHPEPRPVRR